MVVLNVVAAIASIIGTVVGLPSLVIGLVQLNRTKRAAEAASAAAQDALFRISGVMAVASLEQICSRSRELLRVARNRNLSSTATAAFELLEVVSKFSKTRMASSLSEPTEWDRIQKIVSDLHSGFVSAAAINKIDSTYKRKTLTEIAELHSYFNMMASTASERAGETHVHSKGI
jgi:hypothetical protein